ncbi:MAG: PilZ domain-containing protein [Nitrospinae bacterium]|nr:PilZ domain-containing protein [Nitrospinota bacterium]
MKKIFAKTSVSIPPANWEERRDAYRLDLAKTVPHKIHAVIENGTAVGGVLRDLSARGFSCELPKSANLPKGYTVKVSFRLPLDESRLIKTEAVYINRKDAVDGRSPVEAFDFSENLDEATRDLIHQFIIRKQLESIRENKSRPRETLRG